MSNQIHPAGTSWDSFKETLLTPEEQAEIDLQVKIVGKFIEARDAQHMSQRALAEKTGIKQPVIARIESGTSTPKISTLLKLLKPLGYTLDIVPLTKENAKAAPCTLE